MRDLQAQWKLLLTLLMLSLVEGRQRKHAPSRLHPPTPASSLILQLVVSSLPFYAALLYSRKSVPVPLQSLSADLCVSWRASSLRLFAPSNPSPKPVRPAFAKPVLVFETRRY